MSFVLSTEALSFFYIFIPTENDQIEKCNVQTY